MTKFIMIALAMLSMTSVVSANDYYVGTEYGYADQRSGNEDTQSVALNVGTKFTETLGAEVGISKSLSENVNGAKVDGYSAKVEGIMYTPVLANTDLLTSAGLVYNRLDVANGSDENKFGWTAGVGAEQYLTETLSARVMAKYEEANLNTFGSDGAFKYTVGLNHKF